MNYNLHLLVQELQSSGLKIESQSVLSLLKLAQAINPLDAWQEVLQAIQEPIPDQVHTAAQYVLGGLTEMYENRQKLSELSPEDLKTAVSMAVNAPNIQSNLRRYAEQFNNLHKTGQAELAKQLWQGTKYLGKGALHILPVIGFVFSFLLALKNFVYGLTTFAKLVKDSGQIGLSWLDVLFPEKLNEKIVQYQEDPEKLKILTRLTKYSKEFSDEAISFASNAVDFVKDVIFLFLDIGSFGWLTIGDISISVVLMGLEYLAESKTLPLFDETIQDIKYLADRKLKELSQLDFENMSDQDLYQWFNDHQ